MTNHPNRSKKIIHQYRQGDILLTEVPELPVGVSGVKAENGRLIVARGEATGHHHSFPHNRGATLFRDDGGTSGAAFFVKVDSPEVVDGVADLCYASYAKKREYDAAPSEILAAEYHDLVKRAVALGAAAWEHQEHWTQAVMPAIPGICSGVYRSDNQVTYTPARLVRVED